MSRVFADPEQDRSFRENGYLVTSFLNSREVEDLLDLFHELVPEIPRDFFASTMSDDSAHRVRVFEEIRKVFTPKLKELLPDYKVSFSIFLAKRPVGHAGKVGIHLDYSLVQNGKDVGVNLWCPLMDTGAKNAGLKVIPKTHDFCEHFGVIPNPVSPFEPFYYLLEEKYSKQLTVAAGDLVLFDSRLLHWSEPNLSDSERISISSYLIPEKEEPHVYIRNPNAPGTLDVLKVSEDVLCRIVPEQPILEPYPEGVSKVRTIQNPMHNLVEDDMERFGSLFRTAQC